MIMFCNKSGGYLGPLHDKKKTKKFQWTS